MSHLRIYNKCFFTLKVAKFDLLRPAFFNLVCPQIFSVAAFKYRLIWITLFTPWSSSQMLSRNETQLFVLNIMGLLQMCLWTFRHYVTCSFSVIPIFFCPRGFLQSLLGHHFHLSNCNHPECVIVFGYGLHFILVWRKEGRRRCVRVVQCFIMPR